MTSSDVIAVVAVLISLSVLVVHLLNRRRLRDREDRAQAEQVAGWLRRDGKGKAVVCLRNGSTQPVYDILWMLRDRHDLDVPTLPPYVKLLPPETTSELKIGDWDDNTDPALRVYLTFRDGRGLVWQRDSHGRLTRTLRPVDQAPPADRLTGRIPESDNQPTGIPLNIAPEIDARRAWRRLRSWISDRRVK